MKWNATTLLVTLGLFWTGRFRRTIRLRARGWHGNMWHSTRNLEYSKSKWNAERPLALIEDEAYLKYSAARSRSDAEGLSQ